MNILAGGPRISTPGLPTNPFTPEELRKTIIKSPAVPRAQWHYRLGLSRGWLRKGAQRVYACFNNGQAGFAALNATELFQLALAEETTRR